MNNKSITPRCKIAVVTFVRNAAATLPKTFESIASQTVRPAEYVVVDGASTDGTVEIIRGRDDIVTRWISEPDDGVVDAQNKAIRLTSAPFVFGLNGDDWIDPHFLQLATAKLDETGADLLFGDLDVYSADGEFTWRLHGDPRFFSSRAARYQMPCVNFPTMVIRRSLFEQVGYFDPGFRICPDFEWLLRLTRRFPGLKVAYVPELVAHFRLGGLSDRKYLDGVREGRRAALLNGGHPLAAWYFYEKRLALHYAKTLLARVLPRPVFAALLGFARKRV